MEPGIYEAYKGRVALVDDRSPGDLSLIINNLREEDAGTYRCRTERRNEPVDLIVEGKTSWIINLFSIYIYSYIYCIYTPYTL